MRKSLIKEYCANCEFCKYKGSASEKDLATRLLNTEGYGGYVFYCGAQELNRKGEPYDCSTLRIMKAELCPKLSSAINIRMKDRNDSDIETVMQSIDTCNKNIEKYTARMKELQDRLAFLQDVNSFISDNIDDLVKLNSITKLNPQVKNQEELTKLKRLVALMKEIEQSQIFHKVL